LTTTRGLFVGLATLDIVHIVERAPGPDEKVVAVRQDVAAGGPAANAAVTFAALGGDAALLTALGGHVLARAAADELAGCGVRVIDAMPDADRPPAVSLVRVVQASGQRSVTSVNAAGVDAGPPADLDMGADVVLVDGHHPRLAIAAARAARAPVLLDGGSWKPGLSDLLRHVDAAICSAAFAVPGEVSAVAALLVRGVPSVAVTHGGGPIEWATREESGLLPVPQVPVRDTLGAGDCLHGAAAFALAGGGEWPDVLAYAADVAAVRVQHPGPREWLPAVRGR
jgi:sugar/nucleoside kinase (ribokinase family)